jgi:hypothetical protein
MQQHRADNGKPNMNAQEIASAVSTAKSSADFRKLIAAVAHRREAIGIRDREIGNTALPTPLRQAACAKGPDAERALDKEAEALAFELGYLDRLEALLYRGQEEAETAELRAEFPSARRRLPGEIEAVRKARAALAQAVDKANATIAVLGEYERAGEPYPHSKTQLAALLEAREAVWTPLRLNLLTPPLPASNIELRREVMASPLLYIYQGTEDAEENEFVYRLRRSHRDPQGPVHAYESFYPT